MTEVMARREVLRQILSRCLRLARDHSDVDLGTIVAVVLLAERGTRRSRQEARLCERVLVGEEAEER